MSNQYLGSRWYKFDFHTHTPASSDYKKPEETETDWLKALMAEEVDCVAITDHVSGGWIDRLKATYAELDKHAEWYRPLHLFPGCEITVSTGQSRVHVLAISTLLVTLQKLQLFSVSAVLLRGMVTLKRPAQRSLLIRLFLL